MLAKDLKIRTLNQQKEFIKKRLSFCITPDGDPSCYYIGHLYPEVIKYFEEQGFKVTRVESELLLAKFHGLPTYVFTPSDDITLSEAELIQSEEFELLPFTSNGNTSHDDDDGDDFRSFIGRLFS